MNQFKINIHIVGAEVSPHADKPSPGCLDICLACSCSVDVTLQHLKVNNIISYWLFVQVNVITFINGCV